MRIITTLIILMALNSVAFERNTMLELYSSESCSSCPPADIWVTGLMKDARVFKTLFPVVFHVDYWNHLSWKDSLSSELMTKRQIDLSQQWEKSSVYTPAFIVNGEEWRKRGSGTLPETTKHSRYELRMVDNSDLNLRIDINSGKGQSEKLILRVALLGFGIETNVTDGENSGHKLVHNFAVLDWDWKNAETGNKMVIKFKKPVLKYTKLAAVAWLEKAGNPVPIQVTGGYLK